MITYLGGKEAEKGEKRKGIVFVGGRKRVEFVPPSHCTSEKGEGRREGKGKTKGFPIGTSRKQKKEILFSISSLLRNSLGEQEGGGGEEKGARAIGGSWLQQSGRECGLDSAYIPGEEKRGGGMGGKVSFSSRRKKRLRICSFPTGWDDEEKGRKKNPHQPSERSRKLV